MTKQDQPLAWVANQLIQFKSQNCAHLTAKYCTRPGSIQVEYGMADYFILFLGLVTHMQVVLSQASNIAY